MATTGEPPLEALIPGLPAIETHLHLEGVDGGSTSRHHEGWLEVHSFAWGVSAGPELRDGGGGRSRRLRPTSTGLTVRSLLGPSGPPLFGAVTLDRHLPSARLECSAGGGPATAVWELADVVVTSYEVAGVATTPVQTFVLEAERVTFTRHRMNADGSAGPSVTHTWDLHRQR